MPLLPLDKVSGMNEIAAFLDARITEDEKAARTGTLPEEVWGARGWYEPARVLSECEAKRRLLQFALADLGEPHGSSVLKLLAGPWAGHGGYRPEWKA